MDGRRVLVIDVLIARSRRNSSAEHEIASVQL